jgi:hypothetical protein
MEAKHRNRLAQYMTAHRRKYLIPACSRRQWQSRIERE